MSVIDSAVLWIYKIANDPSHGYDQGSRWGPDYDCSSLVISSFKLAGVPLTCTYTGNMYGDMTQKGFTDVTSKVNIYTGANLERGDVLLNVKQHTAMYTGNGKMVEAGGNEFGGITGGKPGDQTGNEIRENKYRNHPWNYVLRYTKESNPNEDATLTPVPSNTENYIVVAGDTLYSIGLKFGVTIAELVSWNNISNPNLIYVGLVLKVKAKSSSTPTTPPTSPIKPVEDKNTTHIVEKGDTLWGLSIKYYNTPAKWKDIATANNLKAPYTIYIGQTLLIP